MMKIQGLFSGGGAPEHPEASESESGLRARPRPTFRDRQEELRAGLADLSDLAVEVSSELPPPLPLPLTRRSVTSLDDLELVEPEPESDEPIDLDAVARLAASSAAPEPAVTARRTNRAPLRTIAFVAVALLMGVAGFMGARSIVAERAEAPPLAPAAGEAADPVADVLVLEEEIDTRPHAPVQLDEVVVDAPTPAPPPVRRAQREEPAVVALSEVTEPEPAPALPATPSREDVIAALSALAPDVRACAGSEHYGVVPVRVTIASSGRVTTARVEGGTVVGTEAGSCIARALRQARFPAFSQDRFVVDYPFQL